jgi:hypothetical protein
MRTRRDRELTALQRRALECVRGAGAKGVNLSAYCRSRGVAVRQVYDALIPLRRRGLLPAKLPLKLARSPKSSGSADAFMTVQIASPAVPVVALVKLPGGILIECRAWPPRAWLESLGAAESADAAA